MAPRKNNSHCRTPSSAPLLRPTRVSYRIKRQPASPLPPSSVLDSPSYSPPTGSRVPGIPRPGKYITKPMLPFRRVHQFRPYGVYLRFPGAGFLENRLRRKLEAEMVAPLAAKVQDLENENNALRHHWTIQVELQDRGNGEHSRGLPEQRSDFEDVMRRLTGAMDRGTVMSELERQEAIAQRLEENCEAMRQNAKEWKEWGRDVERRYKNVKREMAVLKAQLDALTRAEEEEEEEQITGDLEAQFERDVMATAAAATVYRGRILRSRGRPE
ncbi:MAG: hypothetical protein Q9172_002372 [Xanthocarpia lactea]